MPKLAQLPANDRAPERDRAEVRRLPRLQPRYFAFLSYSHKDKALADWLHRELERFRVPRALAGRLTANGIVPRRLTPIFRDEHDLAAAGDLGGEIKAALAVSQYLIVLCSPTAAVSRWTNAEIEWFKRDRPEGCVLAAIAAGEPFASEIEGREKAECFPPALRHKYDRRGRPTGKRADPLAADFRVDGEARRTGFLKLVAGMLGVGLDELVQREVKRRHRRLAWLAAASVAGMAVTSTLSVVAIQSRNAARDQRRQAEGLVEFMVGDLRDKLEPIGKLDVLDGVGSRVLAYYSKQDTSELTDDALLQRSRALNLMAGVAYDRGNLKEAEGLYRQAVAGTGEAVRRSPDDPKRLYEHAQNVFYVGEVARFAGRPAQAEAAYREYKRIADKMATIDPDNLKYRMEVLYATEDVGISLYDQHRFIEAQQLFQSAAGPMEKLASLYPTNASYQKELATALAWIADAQRSQGQLDAAIATRTRQVGILDRLRGATADSNVEARLIPAHQGLGLVLMERGQADRAIAELQSAVDQAVRLIPVEPRNADWRSTGAWADLNLAAALLSLGRRDEAAGQVAEGCALMGSLPMTFAVSAKARLQIDCAILRARLALATATVEQVATFANEALRSARGLRSEDPATDRYRLARVYRLLGDIRARAGDSSGAADAWNAALAQLPKEVAERPWETYERVELLRRVGRLDEARTLASKLNALKFHGLS